MVEEDWLTKKENSQSNVAQKKVCVCKVRKPNKRSSLRVEFYCEFGNGERKLVSALVDSGAEVSLIRREFVPQECVKSSPSELVLLAANGQRVEGGGRMCKDDVESQGGGSD